MPSFQILRIPGSCHHPANGTYWLSTAPLPGLSKVFDFRKVGTPQKWESADVCEHIPAWSFRRMCMFMSFTFLKGLSTEVTFF